MKIRMLNKTSQEIFTALSLKEHSIYKVKVKTSKNNVEHNSYLFTGFKTGSYCQVYTNSYEAPIPMQKCYEIEVIGVLDSSNKQY